MSDFCIALLFKCFFYFFGNTEMNFLYSFALNALNVVTVMAIMMKLKTMKAFS